MYKIVQTMYNEKKVIGVENDFEKASMLFNSRVTAFLEGVDDIDEDGYVAEDNSSYFEYVCDDGEHYILELIS